MANEIGNLYEELEEELNVNQTDVDSVLKAIDEKIKWYGKKINNPKYKAIVPIKTKALKSLKTQISENPDVIKQHAAAYAEIARQKQIEREKTIREKGNLFVRDGMIAQQNLTQLANETKLSESEILKLLGAKVKQKKIFTYKDDGVQELEPGKMKQIAEKLSILGKKHIYDFLGVPSNSPLEQVSSAAKAKFTWVTGNSNKTDPIVNATDGLIKLCTPIFKDEKSRRSYDKALENEGFASVREAIEMMKVGTKYISPSQYKQLLDTCTQNGITKDKAEYLIYTTAEKAGIDVDEGAVGEMVTCRYCGALNERSTQSCRACGMPVKVVCPKCGKESADDDYRCTKCGFSLIDMKDARIHITMARTALSGNSIDDAEKELLLAARFWPNCPDISGLNKEIGEKKVAVQGVLDKIKDLCEKKLYYTAKQQMSALPANHALRKEIEGAIDTAEDLLKKADSTSDSNLKLDYYIQALSICLDCKKANDKLKQTPPQAPTGLTATVLGSNIRLSWQKSSSNYISYQIVRKEDAQPSNINDGENLGSTNNSSFDDNKAIAGISYFYAVYSKCADYISTKPALLTTPVMRVEEIDPKIIRVNPQETSLEFSFDFPRGLFAIEIYREDKLIKTLTGTSYIDNGLQTRKTYNYRFVAVYHDSMGNSHKSKGIVLQFTPMPKPRPVELKLQDGEKQAQLQWESPSVGTLCIYYADNAVKYNKNDVISVDTFKAERLNVTGNSCTINKDFSGERFYIPVTIQGNMGVVGNIVSIISLSPLTNVSISRDDNKIEVRWGWEGITAVRICHTIDDGPKRNEDVFKAKTSSPCHIIQIPSSAKSVEVSIMSLVISGGKELLGKASKKVISMKATKVAFEDVKNKRKFGFIASDDYTITIKADSILPCDLHLLVQEQFPPIDLVHYTPVAIISQSDIKPNMSIEVPFTFKRKMRGQSVHFRLIAANRDYAKQVVVTPETRQIK